jgi:cysteinyl-tRNA synthetase
MIRLYNTLTRKKEVFKPLKNKKVGLYTCGPTVYWYAHLGNLRTYLFEDILKRVLEYNSFKVKQVMNITDVGHLTSDADTGEDKLEEGAKKEKKTVWEIAEFYTKTFKNDLKRLNIKEPTIWIKATETIREQINLIKILEKKGFTYIIKDGVYFDTAKLKNYGLLWPRQKQKIKAGARVEIVPGKKNPTDFALWKFSPKKTKRQMEWNSPWGLGFPGWHTECVAMSAKELGIPFDIHCGGIDHILIHHTNEIAQAQAAYGKIPARFWLHGEFLILGKNKMSKSKGNIAILDDLIKKGFNPLAYRYLCLTAHYRKPLSFSLKSLKASQNALEKIYSRIKELKSIPKKNKTYQMKFQKLVNDDLNMPNALALLWQMLDDEKLSKNEKYFLALDFDKIFGLELAKIKKERAPKKILQLVRQREQYRRERNWRKADEIRRKIEKLGYQIEDTKKGPKIKKS